MIFELKKVSKVIKLYFRLWYSPKSEVRFVAYTINWAWRKSHFFGFHAIFHSIGDIIVHCESRHLIWVAAESIWKAGLIGKLVG